MSPFPHAFFKRIKLSAKYIQVVEDGLSKCERVLGICLGHSLTYKMSAIIAKDSQPLCPLK